MKKACVVGRPISHSRSPLIHNYWLSHHHIEGRYEIAPVEPASLSTFLATLGDRGYEGCNVTIPHKESAFQFIANIDDETRRLGAVNTVYRRNGKLCATSTDGEGFIRNLNANAPGLALANSKVAVLGAGGSSMAIVAALLDENVAEIMVFNRTFEKSQALRRRFGSKITPETWDNLNSHIAESSLLVNTTSLGMTGQPRLEIELSALPESATVADIVYTPLLTPLLRSAAERGLTVVEGLGMLLHQAVRGFQLWFAVTPAVTDELYDLVAKDIDPEYRR